jgi:hypothetical protein
MMIRRYQKELKDTWNEFVETSKNGTFLIDRNYMDYHSDRFNDHSLMFYKDEKLIALLPANLKDQTLYSHQGLTYGGLIFDNKIKASQVLEIFDHLINYLRSINITKLIYKKIPYIYHRYPAEEDLYALFRNNAILFRRDISTVINISNKIGFSKSKKCGLSKARQSGVLVKKSDDLDSFMKIEEEVLKNHNTKPVHSNDELRLLMKNFPNNIKLFASFMEDKMVAGVIVFEESEIIHLQYMANSALGMEIGGLDVIVKYLLEEEYKDKKYFDFGISTEQHGRFLNEGLISQKEMFGGRAVCYDHYELDIL